MSFISPVTLQLDDSINDIRKYTLPAKYCVKVQMFWD